MSSTRSTNFISKLDEISALATQHALEEFVLVQPLYRDKDKLHFVITRSSKSLSLAECSEIKAALCELLKLDFFDHDIVLLDRELFLPSYFKEEYGEVISLVASDPSAINAFVKDKLETGHAPSPLAAGSPDSSPDRMEPHDFTLSSISSSEDESVSPSTRKKRKSDSDLQPTSFIKTSKTPLSGSSSPSSSSAFFSSHVAGPLGGERTEPSLLQEIKEPLQAALKIIFENPQYESTAKDFFLKSLEEQHKKPTPSKTSMELS